MTITYIYICAHICDFGCTYIYVKIPLVALYVTRIYICDFDRHTYICGTVHTYIVSLELKMVFGLNSEAHSHFNVLEQVKALKPGKNPLPRIIG